MTLETSIGPIEVNASGRIVWAEDWDRIDELVESGEVYTKFYRADFGGHTHFYVNF